MNEKQPRREPISVSIRPYLVARLTEKARVEQRSRSWLVERAIEEMLNRKA